jgi:hypothetical protein
VGLVWRDKLVGSGFGRLFSLASGPQVPWHVFWNTQLDNLQSFSICGRERWLNGPGSKSWMVC